MDMQPEELSAECIRLRVEYWKAVQEPDRNILIEKRWEKAMELKRQFIRSLEKTEMCNRYLID